MIKIDEAELADVRSEIIQKGVEFLLGYDEVYFKGAMPTAYLVQSLMKHMLHHRGNGDARLDDC